jgi:hypothetical protein
MSDSRDDDYEVGCGKPPRSGQFKPGQSGNLAGHKRHASPPEPKLPTFRPTQKQLGAEAERLIAVCDGNHTFKIPTTEAVVRSLVLPAMKGGVLAQHTHLASSRLQRRRLSVVQPIFPAIEVIAADSDG